MGKSGAASTAAAGASSADATPGGGGTAASGIEVQLQEVMNDPGANVSSSCCEDHSGYIDKFDSRLMWYEDFIVGVFLIVVGVLSLLGNGSSVLMFLQRLRKLTPAEVLLLNLAVMHLFLSVCSYPAPTVSSFSHRWLFGEAGCQVYGFVCYLLGVASITSMTVLAAVRYLKTCSHSYGRSVRSEHMRVVLVGVYVYSVFWALLPLCSFISNYEVEPFGTSCTLNWSRPSHSSRVYLVLAVTFVVVVPSVVMCWCYVHILLLVRRSHHKKLLMNQRPSATSQGRSELQITIVSALVCLGFLVAWLPYCIVSVIYGLMGRSAPVYVSLAPVLLAKSSCAFNPVIYVFVNARYRTEILGILKKNLHHLLCCLRVEVHDPADHDDDQSASSVEGKLTMTRLNRESPAPQETHSHTTSIKPDLTMSSMASIKPDLTPICLKPDLTTTSIMLDIITTTTPDTTSSLKQENLTTTTTTTTTTASTTSIKQEVGQNPVSKASPEEGTSGFSTALQLNTNSNNLHKNIPEEL